MGTVAAGEIDVNVQWSAKIRPFDRPNYGPYAVALVEPARELMLSLPREEFVFTTLRGTHYTPSLRTHHWNRVRAAAGLGHMTLYLATRHYFGWYAVNVLAARPAIVAEQLGHKHGGQLVEQLYGWSLGATIAVRYAAQHPEQVGGLVLIDGAYPIAMFDGAGRRKVRRQFQRLGWIMRILAALGRSAGRRKQNANAE